MRWKRGRMSSSARRRNIFTEKVLINFIKTWNKHNLMAFCHSWVNFFIRILSMDLTIQGLQKLPKSHLSFYLTLPIFWRIGSKLYVVIDKVWNSYLFQNFGCLRECQCWKVWNTNNFFNLLLLHSTADAILSLWWVHLFSLYTTGCLVWSTSLVLFQMYGISLLS